jgi:hypothetical protein
LKTVRPCAVMKSRVGQFGLVREAAPQTTRERKFKFCIELKVHLNHESACSCYPNGRRNQRGI